MGRIKNKSGEAEAAKLILAGQIIESLNDALRDGETGLESVPKLMETVLDDELWKKRRVKGGKIVEHKRFVDFIITPPIEGLGEKPEMIKRLLHGTPGVLAAFEAAIVGEHGTNQHTRVESDNITLHSERGTSKAYTLRRLKKQRPDLFKMVVAGELSANAAAIKAGFRKEPAPLDILTRTWKKATAADRKQFLQWLDTDDAK